VLWGTTLLGFLAALGIIDHHVALSEAPLPPSCHSGVIRRVGVLGDAQKGLANLRNITRQVLKEDVSFLLQTGDLVANNDIGHYRLAQRYLKKGGATSIPYVTPGNHDLKGGAELFRAFCGDLERSFADQNVALVLLNNAVGNPVPDPRHVEERIAAAGPHNAVVLAMHQPPFDVQGNPIPEYAAFLAWLEKSKVAYLICGHVHAYLRKQVGNTTVIINGVGGDYDKWQLDQKVYATILDVDGARITDRRIELEPVHEVWENMEHLAVGHVVEAFRRKPVLCWLGTLVLAAGVGWGWARLLGRPRRPAPDPGPPAAGDEK
jgi:3',5'-cyclic AMP phosphodiesterase CpdA